MKKLIIILILVIFNSCCSECSDEPSFDGPLEEAVFKQKNDAFGKVLQGNDGLYNYKAFGNFKNTGTQGLFVPEDISFIEQTLIGTNEKTIIKVDRNFLPLSFYTVSDGIKDSLEYHVYTLEEEIVILQDQENEDGSFTTITEVNLPIQVLFENQQRVKIQEEECQDFFSEESEFNICNYNSIYDQYAKIWEDYTGIIPGIKQVGKAVSWTIKISKANMCRSSNKSMEGELSCVEFEENKEKEDLCDILLSCESDCAGEAYGAAYKTPCETCVGGKTQKMPLMASWTYSDYGDNCWTMYAHAKGGQPPYTISWGGSSMVFCGETGARGNVVITDSSGCTAEDSWIIASGESASNMKSKLSPAPVPQNLSQNKKK